ncbi:hypothetical protein B0H67DRAFT_489964 [Lasiosphaeris hirsuta]|uniref:T6SS Phospholipase effector Tle1-like catalytic domain-containing protein n=1 Tax=Lasiosphaeris hirsuta TaxID=260670 RepID=A0AA40AF93_9PEZI|nr:hypothetical protein B0H67DRAFT_489964 [Lasiosphaeris hirsuta]
MAEPRPRIVVLCDGTWCGRETGTRTNIYRLAKLFGVDIDDPDTTEAQFRPPAFPPFPTLIHARYRHGVGLGSTFLDYLFHGITAQDLADEVIAAYRYIVESYTPDYEIWLFGLSRGAYTVRAVAGMINNCGVLRPRDDEAQTDLLCREAYRMYRSNDPVNDPHSPQMVGFRARMAWPLIGDGEQARPPVRFMGLFDTVGGLGIPTFTGGVGLEWPEFHNDVVSSVVQDVCQLLSVHDRFYIFQPCLARRKGGRAGIDEEWLPGAHYDLGRQRFQFWRSGAGAVERLFGAVGSLPVVGWRRVIEPNEVLSDLALWKMLKRIGEHDEGHLLISQSVLDAEMAKLVGAMTERQRLGSGDVYAHISEYVPFGSSIERLISHVAGGIGIWNLFVDLRERVIPNDDANVYPFFRMDTNTDMQSVGQLADITEARYPAKTALSWALRSGRAWP